MSTKYPYAVMDGNEASDQYRTPWSCHLSLDRARKECDRMNRGANRHYYVVHWGASRWARERPSPTHDGAIYGRPQ